MGDLNFRMEYHLKSTQPLDAKIAMIIQTMWDKTRDDDELYRIKTSMVADFDKYISPSTSRIMQALLQSIPRYPPLTCKLRLDTEKNTQTQDFVIRYGQKIRASSNCDKILYSIPRGIPYQASALKCMKLIGTDHAIFYMYFSFLGDADAKKTK